MTNAVELIAQKRLTREFIKADPASVELIRGTKIPSGNGGVKSGPVDTKDPQTFRLVPANSSVFAAYRDKLEGSIPKEDFLLIGLLGADIEIGDQFSYKGGRYEVTYISTERTYETAASVIYRGPLG